MGLGLRLLDDPEKASRGGWAFDPSEGFPDPVLQAKDLREVYDRTTGKQGFWWKFDDEPGSDWWSQQKDGNWEEVRFMILNVLKCYVLISIRKVYWKEDWEEIK